MLEVHHPRHSHDFYPAVSASHPHPQSSWSSLPAAYGQPSTASKQHPLQSTHGPLHTSLLQEPTSQPVPASAKPTPPSSSSAASRGMTASMSSDYTVPSSTIQHTYRPADAANTKAYSTHAISVPPYFPPASHDTQTSYSSRVPSRPASPVFQQFPIPSVDANGRRSSAAAISAYLQLPSTITNSKGSLSEFAAQITCLFWFESSYTLAHIEDSRLSPVATSRLVPEAFPSTGFLKWVTTILSTTQVTQNVILLALLFIYRLKKQNPTVKGQPGSEYRLLTVALMLGNKFLDDNTYTNKTWAEVSGISVQEIHVMEVEFLSHMKYTLYTSAESWQQWHQQLGRFWNYFDKASKRVNESMARPVPALRPSPLQMPYTLPSPPTSNSASPPYPNTSSVSPSYVQPLPSQATVANQSWTPSTSGSSVHSDSGYGGRNGGRKRSYDSSGQEPQAKRSYGAPAHHSYAQSSTYMAPYPPTTYPSLPSLPTPNLQMPLQPPVYPHDSASSTPSNAGHNQPGFLPPVNWLQGVPQLLPIAGHAQPSGVHSAPASHRQILRAVGSRDSSPSNQRFYNPNTHTPSQAQLSPSFFLTQRNSPYRPVRNISTLLVPPQAGPMPEPAAHISHEQMHWQPLAKTNNETKQGRVPYLHRDAWPETHQVEHWPSTYQTNV